MDMKAVPYGTAFFIAFKLVFPHYDATISLQAVSLITGKPNS